MTRPSTLRTLALFTALSSLVLACVMQDTQSATRHRWWNGLGPVLPHDTFPAECKLCHEGETWDVLVDDFEYDHEAETGVRLEGAHKRAGCLRCHNDRGPASDFQARGCQGCHEDVHQGELGAGCEQCHQQNTWLPGDMIALHNRTRFPLTGVHAWTNCIRCHAGATVGRFLPVDTDCLSCHADDLQNAQNPNHFVFGYTANCDRCHIPTNWNQAESP